jgi:hypothetical protein
MSELEWRAVSPHAFIGELEEAVRQRQENKYAFQVGLKDLDFEVDEDQAKLLGVKLPFQGIDRAECALREQVIRPTTFLEDDDTEHLVSTFDAEPVGFSGYMSCVTHSLALTDQGLFEVGRYPAMDLVSQHRYWQWFLHRRLATSEQVAVWKEHNHLSNLEVVEQFYEAMTGRARRREG